MERLLVEFCIRAALIVLTTAVVLRALRIKTAAAQHAVWVGMLMVMLLLPLWLVWGPKASVAVLPARDETPVAFVSDELPVPAVFVDLHATNPPAARPVWNWNAVSIGVYLAGAFVLLLRLGIGTVRAKRLTSAACVAPVTVGFLRPRIILPACSSDWPQAQLDAVLTHERAHASRRDPLFQWLALFNRAVFWFHPLAWWLERKLSALAEEACDAAVLECGHDPREYSQYLLELARAVKRAGTRVNAVAMAMPGSWLPQRVKNIIEGVRAPRLSPARMTFAALACAIPAIVFAAGTLDHVPQLLRLPLPATPAPQPPILLAQAVPPAPVKAPEAPKLEFEVASVRLAAPPDGGVGVFRSSGIPGPNNNDPGRFTARTSLMNLILMAYNIPLYRLSAPDDIYTLRLEVEAKMPVDTTREQFEMMLQNLLAERFGLKVHWTEKQLETYELVLAKGGPKFRLATPDPPPGSDDTSKKPEPAFGINWGPDGFPVPPPGNDRWMAMARGKAAMRGHNETAHEMASGFSVQLGGPVTDATGLTGKYDYTIFWSTSATSAALGTAPGTDGPDGPSLLDAIQDQLGLKIEKRKGPVQVLVVDHLEKKPTEN
ncbi:MAG TPA: M56 family metallopeptidase [Bryobacteraceae bacterium]|jgi:uncharacterized protein (TIGR03435 family)